MIRAALGVVGLVLASRMLEERRPGWVIVLLPLFEPEDADSIISQIEAG